MAAKKKNNKKIVENDDAEEVQSSDTSQSSSVEAAYWEGKVQSTTAKKGERAGKPRQVEEYTSNIMVEAKPNESSEQLLRRFNREVRDLNLIDEIRDRLEYEKPSQRRKREKREKIANARRYQRFE